MPTASQARLSPTAGAVSSPTKLSPHAIVPRASRPAARYDAELYLQQKPSLRHAAAIEAQQAQHEAAVAAQTAAPTAGVKRGAGALRQPRRTIIPPFLQQKREDGDRIAALLGGAPSPAKASSSSAAVVENGGVANKETASSVAKRRSVPVLKVGKAQPQRAPGGAATTTASRNLIADPPSARRIPPQKRVDFAGGQKPRAAQTHMGTTSLGGMRRGSVTRFHRKQSLEAGMAAFRQSTKPRHYGYNAPPGVQQEPGAATVRIPTRHQHTVYADPTAISQANGGGYVAGRRSLQAASQRSGVSETALLRSMRRHQHVPPSSVVPPWSTDC